VWKKHPGASLNHQRSLSVKKRDREGRAKRRGEEEKKE